MFKDILSKATSNSALKIVGNAVIIGCTCLATSLLNQTMRELSHDTLGSIAQTIRKARNEFKEQKAHKAA